jgi:ABC-type cobalt transport system substrate-binding protein
MKKSVLIFSMILSVVLVAGLVSAQFYGDFQGAASQIIQWIQQIFGPFFQILLGVNAVDQYFFSRILLLILLYVVILAVLKKIDLFKRNTFAYILISAIVAILGARYLSEIDIMETILLPYGAVAISLVVFLPLFVYAFLVHTSVQTSLGRKLGWILFAVVFLGLWLTRYKEMGQYNWLYLIGIVAVAFIFLFDSKVHEYFGLFEARKAKRQRIQNSIAQREEQLVRYRGIPNPSKSTQDVIDRLEREIEELHRQL